MFHLCSASCSPEVSVSSVNLWQLLHASELGMKRWWIANSYRIRMCKQNSLLTHKRVRKIFSWCMFGISARLPFISSVYQQARVCKWVHFSFTLLIFSLAKPRCFSKQSTQQMAGQTWWIYFFFHKILTFFLIYFYTPAPVGRSKRKMLSASKKKS